MLKKSIFHICLFLYWDGWCALHINVAKREILCKQIKLQSELIYILAQTTTSLLVHKDLYWWHLNQNAFFTGFR